MQSILSHLHHPCKRNKWYELIVLYIYIEREREDKEIKQENEYSSPYIALTWLIFEGSQDDDNNNQPSWCQQGPL